MLSSCSTTESINEDSQLENDKFFGTVVSVKRTKDFDWQGAGNIASAGAQGTASALSGGWLNGLFGSSNANPSDLGPAYGFIYVIQKEEGGRVTVRATDERLYHPGEDVMVVMNNSGFANVYPRDLEHAHPGGL